MAQAIKIKSILKGDWLSPGIVHHCRPGCCTSEKHSLERALKVADECLMPSNLTVISLDQWTGYDEPSKVCLVGYIHNLVPRAWGRMITGWTDADSEAHAQEIDEDQY